MIELELMHHIVEQHQAYLRSLAGHRPIVTEHASIRQRAGRTVVRFGEWLEGRRPETVVKPSVVRSRHAV